MGWAAEGITMHFFTKTKDFLTKLLAGGFGLPVTFWIFGALIAVVLGVLIKMLVLSGN